MQVSQLAGELTTMRPRRRARISTNRAKRASIARCSASLSTFPTRGAKPVVEIATRTGPAFAIAAIATKP